MRIGKAYCKEKWGQGRGSGWRRQVSEGRNEVPLLVQAAKDQCFHGKSGSAGEQGEMGDKPEFFKRLSLLLMSLKL